MILKQGRIVFLLAALAGAALFLLVSGCKGDEKAVPAAPAAHKATLESAVSGARAGIGPDAGGEGALMYEEGPFSGFSDYLGQIDYSIAKAIQLSGNSLDALKVEQALPTEYEGHLYSPYSIRINGVKNIPELRQAINDSLLAWAERAAVIPSDEPDAGGKGDLALQIMVDGSVLTHYLYLSPLAQKPRDLSEGRPRLVIVLDDLGESKRQARRLLALDFPVTFAVWPRSTHAAAVAVLGHEGGAEVIVHQPMEPVGYPTVNPGEGVILQGMGEKEIIALLEDNFARVPHATGLNNHMGSRLTQDEAAMRVVSRYAAGRGLIALDSLTHAKSRFSRAAAEAGAQTYRRDVFLDVEADKGKIIGQLKKAEQIALVKGQAIAIGHPLAATLDALEEWQRERDARVALVRLSDLAPIPAAIRQPGNNDKN